MIYIKDIGSHVAEEKIDNYLNAARFSESEKFIDDKIGATKLPRISKNIEASDLAIEAIRNLITKTDLNIEDIEALVIVTQNGDFGGLPHTSAIIHGKLGLKTETSCFDISLGCSGYVYGLSVLKSHMIEMGFKNGILVTVDPYSKIINPDDKVTSLLFGDAATATLLSNEGKFEICRPLLSTDGKGYAALLKKDFLSMNGRQVFEFAAMQVPPHIELYLTRACLTKEDIDIFLLHQGSAAIVKIISRKLGIKESKAPLDIKETGNTISSSIPLILEKIIKQNNRHIIISGFGVGLSWATNLLRRL